MIQIIIEGDPVPKQRHRYCIRHGKIMSYDPQDEVKKSVKTTILLKMHELLNHPDQETARKASNLTRSDVFVVDLTFYLPMPNKRATGLQNVLLWNGDHVTKPDIDNLVKFYLDCANGIIWPDDKSITKLTCSKHFSENPRVVINISGRKGTMLHPDTQQILGIFSPTDMLKLAERLEEISNSICDMVEEAGPQNCLDNRQLAATRAAILISQLAENFGDRLHKIKHKYPKYYENRQEFIAKTRAIYDSIDPNSSAY